MKVRVYRNLRKHCFSVQDYKTRKVIDHVDNCVILNPKFVVSEAGRQRVLRTKTKNVHAFIVGELAPLDYKPNVAYVNEVTYDPFKYDSFVLPYFNNAKITEAEVAFCEDGKNVFIGLNY